MLTVLVSSIITAACVASGTHGPSSDDRGRPRGVVSSTDTIAINRDAYLGPDPDDYWKGTTDSLVVDGVRSTRILIGVNQTVIAAAVGSGTLVNATLELTVRGTNGSWPVGGATVDVHRVLQDWTEADVTWVCSDGHTVWDMSTGAGTIWHTAHTARTTITNGQTGVVRLDVTADVAAFLGGGQTNYGWLIKRTSEGAGDPGRISFASREGVAQPRLIIQLTSDTARPPVPYDQMLAAGDSTVVVSPPTAPGELTEEYFRTVFFVRFRLDAPGTVVREVLQRYGARIVGGLRDGTYIIEVPDPGASYAEYEAFLNSLKAEASVDAVMPYHSRLNITTDGRYPEDGAGFARADWIAGASSTWALRAIRAPLAWGCETGGYSTSNPITVAALEVMVPAVAHPDLASSIVGAIRYGNPQAGQAALPPSVRDRAQFHANAVMGHLAASGDNAQFAAGVMWRSRLVRFSNADPAARPAIPVHMIQNVVSPDAQAEGLRILNISMEWYDTKQPEVLEFMTQAFRTLLTENPALIIVKAMANNGLTAQATDLAQIKRMGAFNYSLSTLAQEGFGDRIVFVAGTSQGNTWWTSSNFIHGITDVAAPAEDVALLNLPASASYGQFPQFDSGTSYAAPLVAGAIAQLLAMDPSLSATQINGYLKRGAQEPKQDPNTGLVPLAADSTNWRVQGAGSRAVYQLDLYGALALLSRERQGAPLCGLEAVYRYNPAQQTYSVTANRQAPELIISNAPLGELSVAQGGRLLAIANQPYRLQNGVWTAGNPISNTSQVVYLERDTVSLRLASSGVRTDLYARLNQGGEQNLSAGLPGGLWWHGAGAGVSGVSPTGDFLHFRWQYGDGDFCTATSIAGGGEYVARRGRAGGKC